MKFFFSLLFFIFLGLASAATSLLLSLLFYDVHYDGIINIIFFVVLEESIKLFFLNFAFKILEINKFITGLFFAAFFGFGFALFETILILMDKTELNLSIILIYFIHILTSAVLSLGISKNVKEKTTLWITFVFYLLAIVLHLCYNLIAIKNI